MCIAYLAINTHSEWPLVIAANRDEFHARPTRPAALWTDNPSILGGRDLLEGGTWLGVQRQGRFALLTNHRNLHTPETRIKSRGALTTGFLTTSLAPLSYLEKVADNHSDYQGFNLIVGQWLADLGKMQVAYYSNRSSEKPKLLSDGHYVVSNHLLNTPWPKSQRLLSGFTELVKKVPLDSVDEAFALLRDQEKAPETDLPATGLSLEREHLLSSPFIVSPDYGTRSSTFWAVNKQGRSVFNECTYDNTGTETERHSWPLSF